MLSYHLRSLQILYSHQFPWVYPGQPSNSAGMAIAGSWWWKNWTNGKKLSQGKQILHATNWEAVLVSRVPDSVNECTPQKMWTFCFSLLWTANIFHLVRGQIRQKLHVFTTAHNITSLLLEAEQCLRNSIPHPMFWIIGNVKTYRGYIAWCFKWGHSMAHSISQTLFSLTQ